MRFFRRMVAVLVLVAAGMVQAAPFDDAVAAYKQGDYATAERGFRALALQGDASSQYNLGWMYANGQGVPKDDQQAVFWYRKAADQGHAKAQYNLGFMYAKGEGVPKDDQQAVSWYRKAADQGNASAQYNLGLMYAKGEGVPKDDQLAYFWWLLSSVSGDASSIKNRDIVEAKLTSQKRATAQAHARDWKPRKQ